jgi:hypothetical protein
MLEEESSMKEQTTLSVRAHVAAAVGLGVAFMACGIGPVPAWAQSLQERAAAAQGRWTEYREQIESSDPIARAEALRVALNDENIGIRDSALWLVLQRRDALPVAVVLEKGGRIGPGDLPNPEISALRWNLEQHSFEGRSVSYGYATRAIGRILEGTVQIRYERMRMPSFTGQPSGVPPTKNELVLRDCTVVLAIDASDSALAGPLRCENMSQTLHLRMPLS